MQPVDLELLRQLLKAWAKEDFGDDKGYLGGYWSRRNLAAMIADIEVRLHGNEQSTDQK